MNFKISSRMTETTNSPEVKTFLHNTRKLWQVHSEVKLKVSLVSWRKNKVSVFTRQMSSWKCEENYGNLLIQAINLLRNKFRKPQKMQNRKILVILHLKLFFLFLHIKNEQDWEDTQKKNSRRYLNEKANKKKLQSWFFFAEFLSLTSAKQFRHRDESSR